jgi:hypothetical protein
MASSGMLRRVALVRTEVSEELSASFIKMTRISELGTTLAVTSNRRTLRRNTWYFLLNSYSYNISATIQMNQAKQTCEIVNMPLRPLHPLQAGVHLSLFLKLQALTSIQTITTPLPIHSQVTVLSTSLQHQTRQIRPIG